MGVLMLTVSLFCSADNTNFVTSINSLTYEEADNFGEFLSKNDLKMIHDKLKMLVAGIEKQILLKA
jgi:hypothetical protein